MPDFVPSSVPSPCDFDVAPDRHGHWVARDRHGLAGGVFVTRKAALSFALFEAGGNALRVHEPDSTSRPADIR
ncbi:MAG: hypothetical protein JO267_05130 [Alphaproteobacteria bacterium]|nr:hypothetical protein [Alphaproteobacteria bacterium]